MDYREGAIQAARPQGLRTQASNRREVVPVRGNLTPNRRVRGARLNPPRVEVVSHRRCGEIGSLHKSRRQRIR